MSKQTQHKSSLVSISLKELVALRALPQRADKPRSMASAQLAGGHRSRFRGRGMEFAEVRGYQPGDDVRSIDWRVTARRGKVHTKLFHEERERPVLFSIDYRRPMFFATRGRFKAVLASQLAALLAWQAMAQGDRIGGFLFSEEKRTELRPRGGHRGVLQLLNAMTGDPVWQRPPHQPFQPHQHLAETVQRLLRVTRPGSRVHLFSDLTQWDDSVEKHLAVLSRQAEISLYFIFDPLEAELPQGNNYRLSDGNSDLLISTASSQIRSSYRRNFATLRERVSAFCKSYRIAFYDLETTSDPQQFITGSKG